MALWEKFEIDCTEYLNRKFGKYANFIHKGGADSTLPDIFVKTVSGNSFYIDAKYSPAQCGQFVLFPNIETNSFEYSKQNVNCINEWANIIIKHMDKYFDEFREAGTTGKDIIIDNSQKVFANWIIDSYKDKNVKFFITNDYNILPIEKIADYFEISAKYRIKRSGSSSLGKSKVDDFTKLLSNNAVHNYMITDIRVEGNKLFVSSDKDLHNLRVKDRMSEYMFSARNGEYEVRKLSNTYNANVIFAIRFKGDRSGLSDKDFINYLH